MYLTLRTTYDDGTTIEFEAPDWDTLTSRWQELADVRTLVTLTAGGLGPEIVPDVRQPQNMPADPWGQPPASQNGAQSPGGTFRTAATATRAAPVQESTITVQTPNGLQVWTLAPNGAPSCKCGEPAALVHGTNRNGGAYNAYRCAKGAGDNWRTKCDFNQWA